MKKTGFVKLILLVICISMLAGLCSCGSKEEPSETAETTAEESSDTDTEAGETTAASVPAIQSEPSDTTAAEGVFTPESKGYIHSEKYSEETPYAPVVLTYHLIEEEPFGEYTGMFMRPEEFDDQLRVLKEAGYEFMFADEYCFSSNKCVIITFDDGYVDNYTKMLPILKKYGVPATVFVITKLVDVRSDYLSTAMIREMSDSGYVHIGSHTVNHDDMRSMPEDKVRSELRDSKAFLEGAIGRPVTAVSYPTGGYSETVMKVAAEYYHFGYTTVQQKDTSKCSLYAISRLSTARGESGEAILQKIS